MAFRLDRRPWFAWPVTVGVVEDGVVTTEEFTAHFRQFPETEFRAHLNELQNGTVSEFEMADKVLVGWDGITSDNDPVTYSPAVKNKLLQCPGVAAAVISSWVDARVKAAEKNSGMPRITGRAPTE